MSLAITIQCSRDEWRRSVFWLVAVDPSLGASVIISFRFPETTGITIADGRRTRGSRRAAAFRIDQECVPHFCDDFAWISAFAQFQLSTMKRIQDGEILIFFDRIV